MPWLLEELISLWPSSKKNCLLAVIKQLSLDYVIYLATCNRICKHSPWRCFFIFHQCRVFFFQVLVWFCDWEREVFDIPCHFRIHLPPKVFIPSLSLEANIRDWKDLKKFLKVVWIRRCSGTSRKQCSETGKFYYNILFFFFYYIININVFGSVVVFCRNAICQGKKIKLKLLV